MDLKCYLCDGTVSGTPFTFKIGMKEELICEECNLKTTNRRKALQDEAASKK